MLGALHDDVEPMNPHGPELGLAAALASGLVIGAERERRKGDGPSRKPAGIRTFVVVALLGGIADQLGQPMLVAAGCAVALFSALGYALGERDDPGLTTEVALVLTYALGAYAQQAPLIALATAVLSATVLAFRTRLHGFVTSLVTRQEMLDALIFGVCALVIWPLLPNRTIDPLGAVNPFVLWRLVVLVMGITALGHIAERFVGPRFGLAVAGFASGFVSSSATIHTMGARAREHPELSAAAVAGAVASSVATFVELGILVGATSPRLLLELAAPLACGGGAALAYAIVAIRRVARTTTPLEKTRSRAFRFRTALMFAVLVTVVTSVTRLVQQRFGTAGALAAAALGGLADAHATAASVASLHAHATLAQCAAGLAVLLALSTNTLVKAVLAFASGGRTFGLRVLAGLVVMLALAWAAALLLPSA